MTSDRYFEEYGLFAEVRSASFIMPSMHAHTSYELYFLLSGTREYFIEDTFINVLPGDVVLIPPNTLHKTGGGGSDTCRALVGFRSDYLSRYFTPEVTDRLQATFRKRHVRPEGKDAEKLIAIVNALRENQAAGEQRDSYLLLGELLYLLDTLPQPVADAYAPENYRSAVVKYVRENYRTIHGIEDTAKHFFLTKSHFCRSFKRETGIGFVEYLNKVKLNAASDLLIFSEKSVREITESVGYNSAPYFCSLFRKEYGMTPRAYRKAFKT